RDATQRFEAHILGTTFSPDGRYYLAMGDSGPLAGIPVWEVETGKKVSEFFPGGELWYHTSVFLPDSQHVLSAFRDGSYLYLWEVSTGKLVRKFSGHARNNVSVGRISSDGQRVLSWGLDRTIRVWELPMGKQLQCIEVDDDIGGTVEFSPD